MPAHLPLPVEIGQAGEPEIAVGERQPYHALILGAGWSHLHGIRAERIWSAAVDRRRSLALLLPLPAFTPPSGIVCRHSQSFASSQRRSCSRRASAGPPVPRRCRDRRTAEGNHLRPCLKAADMVSMPVADHDVVDPLPVPLSQRRRGNSLGIAVITVAWITGIEQRRVR